MAREGRIAGGLKTLPYKQRGTEFTFGLACIAV